MAGQHEWMEDTLTQPATDQPTTANPLNLAWHLVDVVYIPSTLNILLLAALSLESQSSRGRTTRMDGRHLDSACDQPTNPPPRCPQQTPLNLAWDLLDIYTLFTELRI